MIVDATFRDRADRAAFLERARRPSGRRRPRRVPRARSPSGSSGRAARLDIGAVSDADADVVRRQTDDGDLADDVPAGQHVVLRTDRPAEDALDDLAALLDARLARGVRSSPQRRAVSCGWPVRRPAVASASSTTREGTVMSKIIVGVDQSEGSNDAIALASSLAGMTGAELMLVNVFPYDTHPSRALNAEFESYLREDSDELLERLRSALGDDTVEIKADRRIRRRRTGCTSSPSSEDAALIVVGSTHTGRAGRVLPGSTAERLLHGSPCPVAVAPKGYAHDAGRRARHHRLRLRRHAVRAARARRRPPHRGRHRRAAAGHPRLPAARLRRPAEGRRRWAACAYNDTLQERASEELDAAVAKLEGEPRAERVLRRRRRRPRSSPRRPSSSTSCCSAPAATARCTPCWSAASPAASCARRPAR